ncbi:MAG: ABC transporter permease [Anaerolineales bacterium]|nr:ABC transporter permease [Anaerolineales bacterium]
MNVQSLDRGWNMVLRPQRAWWDLRLREVWQYRYLIMLFVRRDFVAYYKQTILGPVWYIVQPILTTLVFTVIFGNIAQLSTDGLPPFLFYLAGNTIWTYFSTCVTSTSNTFTVNAAIFGKVYFPRLTIPISVILSNLISFGIRLGIFLLFWAFYLFTGSDIKPNFWALFLPVLLLIMAGIGLGVGIIVSSLTTKYRDLQHLVSFGVQLMMYMSPVIYPVSQVHGLWRWLILANPMTPIIELFRLAFLGVSSLNPAYILYSIACMSVVLLTGALVFNHVEATFMDTV